MASSSNRVPPQIKWISESEPTKGFDYLYLSDADHQAYLTKHTAANLPYRATEVPQGPESPPHWRLSDIIGAEDGLGVECLSGSGAIAAAFSRAFHEGFTITLVSGRNVGIGAYLARLGRRYALLLSVRNTACCVLLSQKRSIPFPIAVLATTQHSSMLVYYSGVTIWVDWHHDTMHRVVYFHTQQCCVCHCV